MTAHQRCTHGGGECPRLHQATRIEDDRTMTAGRLLILALVGALCWFAVIAGMVVGLTR